MSTAEEAPGGPIETLRFARLLARFWAQGFTGCFRARSTARPGAVISKEILFERGRVAWAASDDGEESIRTHLINRGLLRPDQWRLAEEKAGSAQARQMLIDLGFLTTRELQEADRERVSALVLSLFNWREGRYEVAPGPLPHGTPNLKVDPRDLVLEGLMSSGDRGKVLDEIGTLDAVLVVRPDDLVRASLSLPVELVGLMSKADGTRTIGDICALSPLSDFLISAALAGLKVLGLARPLQARVTAAPPAPPVPAPEKPPTRRRGTVHAVAQEKAPMLPLYEADPTEYETVPIAATPPGGLPKTMLAAAPALPAPPPKGEVTAHLSGDDPDDSGTRPLAAKEPREAVIESGPIAVSSAKALADRGAGAISAATEDPEIEATEDREAELELKPGIPVGPLSLAPPTASDLKSESFIGESADLDHGAGLEDGEIEDAIQALDVPVPERAEADPDGDRVDDSHEDGEIDLGDEEPAWVYEPSAEPAVNATSRRWVTWGSLAAGLAALGFGLIVLFGGARGAPGARGAAGARGTAEAASPRPPRVEAAPADVVAPAAFATESEPAVPSPSVASAAMTLPQAMPPPTDQAPTARETPPHPVAPAPAKKKIAAAVAPPSAGPIFSTSPFTEGRRLLESGKYADAAARFAAGVNGRKGMYTVQLALACEAPTVARAAGSTRGSSQFFILPTTFKAQACYRLLWGTYPSTAAAAEGRKNVPPAFLKDPHPPVVAAL